MLIASGSTAMPVWSLCDGRILSCSMRHTARKGACIETNGSCLGYLLERHRTVASAEFNKRHPPQPCLSHFPVCHGVGPQPVIFASSKAISLLDMERTPAVELRKCVQSMLDSNWAASGRTAFMK